MRFKKKKPKKKKPADLSLFCGHVREDDGVDPREVFDQSSRKRGRHKERQLCAEVARTLGVVLAGEYRDGVLRELHVVSVVAAPDVRRLLVTVSVSESLRHIEPAEVLARLQSVAGKLRTEVAGALTRKRTPELTFRVAAGGVAAGGVVEGGR